MTLLYGYIFCAIWNFALIVCVIGPRAFSALEERDLKWFVVSIVAAAVGSLGFGVSLLSIVRYFN